MQAIDSKEESPLSPVPAHLLEAVREKTCVIYAGAGFSLEAKMRDGAKLPTGSGLGFRLAQELYREGYLSQEPKEDQFFNFESLAEDYQTAFGRHDLILLLHEIFGAEGLMPGEAHELAIKYFPTIITTNFEQLFERAAVLLGRQPIVITRDKQIPFAGALNRPTIIKIHGDLNDPENIVVTGKDYRSHPISEGLRDKLRAIFSEKTVLFIGCGLVDSDLREIYYEVLERHGNLKPRSYLVAPFPAEDSPERKQWELFRKRWEQDGIQFLNGKAGEFLASLDDHLEERKPLVTAIEIQPTASAEELVAEYRNRLTEQVEWVRLFGLEERQKLEKVFVDLTIIEDYHRPHLHAEFLGMMDAGMRRQRSLFSDEDQQEPGREKEKRTVRPDEILTRRTRAVITGAPGCGKTTLLRYLTSQTLKENKRLPVFLELKTVGKDDFEKAHSLTDLLFEKAVIGQSNLDDAQRQRLREHFLARLSAGEAAIFLDGLDELSREAFDDLCNTVNEFVRSTHRDNLLIISTRPYALRSQFDGLEQMEIAPLNQQQVEQFIEYYYRDDAMTARMLQELRRRREVGELARAPMLLGAMISLYRNGREIIEDRPELYRHIVLHLAVRLDEEKGVRRVRQFQLVDPDGSLKREFLKELACERLLIDEVKTDAETGEAARVVFTGEQIVEKAGQFLERTNRLEISPYLLAADVKATPLLREVGADVYAFTHLTIQEYLAAAALERRKDCREIFCQAYFNTTIVEMEVLPMTLGLMNNAAELYTMLDQLPESLNFASLRLRARGLGYGANAGGDHVNRLIVRLKEFLERSEKADAAYEDAVARSFSRCRRYEDLLVETLIPLLRKPFPSHPAYSLLGMLGGEKAETTLLAFLESDRSLGSLYALSALTKGNSDKVVNILHEALKNESTTMRWSAAEELGRFKDQKTVSSLIVALTDKETIVRWSAAESLGRIGDRTSINDLIRLLESTDESISLPVAFTLAMLGYEPAKDILLDALKSKNTNVELRSRAASALGTIRYERAIPDLVEASKDVVDVSRSAVEAIREIGGEQAVLGLLEILKIKESDVHLPASEESMATDQSTALQNKVNNIRWRAAKELGNIGDIRAVGGLIEALKDRRYTGTQWRAAEALGKIGGEQAIQALVEAVNTEESFVRRSAALAIANIGNKRFLEKQIADECLEALSDSDELIRVRAIEAIGKIGVENAVPKLIDALEHEMWVSETAARVLDEFERDHLAKGLLLALSYSGLQLGAPCQ